MRVIAGVLIVLALVGAGGISYAEPTGKLDKGEKAQERLEIITMWKMMEALDLDKASADKILEIRHRFLAKRKELQSSLTEDMKTLKQSLSPTTAPDDKELARLLVDIRDKRRKLTELWDLQYEEVSKILTIKQQAELVVFLKEFQKDLRSILHPGGVPGEGRGRPDFDPRMMGPHHGPPPPPPPRGPHEPEPPTLGPDE